MNMQHDTIDQQGTDAISAPGVLHAVLSYRTPAVSPQE